jgi:hypothetical protein
MKSEKVEKIVGYAFLAFGLALIVFAAIFALWVFLAGVQIPQFVPVPTAEQDSFARAFAFFSNVCLAFFLLVIVVWGGAIVTSRGVTLVKDVKLKLMRKSLREAADAADKAEEAEEA